MNNNTEDNIDQLTNLSYGSQNINKLLAYSSNVSISDKAVYDKNGFPNKTFFYSSNDDTSTDEVLRNFSDFTTGRKSLGVLAYLSLADSVSLKKRTSN